jgi:fructose-1,6-bisphosphatase I
MVIIHTGEFVLTHPNVRIPKRGKVYSFNEARSHQWDKGVQKYIEALKTGKVGNRPNIF